MIERPLRDLDFSACTLPLSGFCARREPHFPPIAPTKLAIRAALPYGARSAKIVLRGCLSLKSEVMSAELAFNRNVEVAYGVAEKIAPGIRRVVANNPGPYTFLGTNTYIIGRGEVAIIDPGPDDERHLGAIAEATKGERITHILITHSHRDHCGGTRRLKSRLGGEILAYGPSGTKRGACTPGLGEAFVDANFVPDHALEDGASVRGSGFALDVMHTPGHAPDHLCFALVGQRTVFTGDHVMGWNTTMVAPPEGSMAEFLGSLERLLKRHDKMFLPGHGGRIQTPQRVTKAYLMHRRWREQTILTCLDEGERFIPRIVERIYGELDADRRQAAALSVLAHLEHMISRGLVAAEGDLQLSAAYFLCRRDASVHS
jgi:glyoxylase-like metal-dependent hydrolase (beta-lactamase superfamily II)